MDERPGDVYKRQVFKGVKAALKFQGYDCGLCREPFLPLSKREERRLYETLLENDCL